MQAFEEEMFLGEEEKLKQVGFRCSEAFYNRLDVERKRRKISIQEMVIEALERHWAQADETRSLAPTTVRQNVSKFWATPEQEDLVRVLFKTLQAFPPAKLELVKLELELDADAYRKAASRNSRFASRHQ
jgi:hypothetical protein